jgi:DNA-binding transcriptional LysR family regulator
VVFGAPAYFARHGRPGDPGELARRHQCILRTTDEADSERWPFRVGGRRRSVRVHGRFRTDSAAAAHAAVARGIGIGLAPLWQIRSLVDEGVVEVILEQYETARIPVHVVWPPTKVPLAKTRLFTEFLAARLKKARL